MQKDMCLYEPTSYVGKEGGVEIDLGLHVDMYCDTI